MTAAQSGRSGCLARAPQACLAGWAPHYPSLGIDNQAAERRRAKVKAGTRSVSPLCNRHWAAANILLRLLTVSTLLSGLPGQMALTTRNRNPSAPALSLFFSWPTLTPRTALASARVAWPGRTSEWSASSEPSSAGPLLQRHTSGPGTVELPDPWWGNYRSAILKPSPPPFTSSHRLEIRRQVSCCSHHASMQYPKRRRCCARLAEDSRKPRHLICVSRPSFQCRAK